MCACRLLKREQQGSQGVRVPKRASICKLCTHHMRSSRGDAQTGEEYIEDDEQEEKEEVSRYIH
jgi:hypothetical protein